MYFSKFVPTPTQTTSWPVTDRNCRTALEFRGVSNCVFNRIGGHRTRSCQNPRQIIVSFKGRRRRIIDRLCTTHTHTHTRRDLISKCRRLHTARENRRRAWVSRDYRGRASNIDDGQREQGRAKAPGLLSRDDGRPLCNKLFITRPVRT